MATSGGSVTVGGSGSGKKAWKPASVRRTSPRSSEAMAPGLVGAPRQAGLPWPKAK
ncbi:MAG: hypothetical protein ACRDZR_04515 [Acidimicrobiales bacterium]